MWVPAGSTLTGVEVPEGNRTFEIKPYGIGSMATDVTAVPRVVNQGAGNGGVDVKFGITENLTADFTYNTDFAQVEVDQQQVNLTRFSLFFPEKREFFLESQGTFDFGRGASFGTFSGGGPTGRRSGGGGFSGGGDRPTIFFSRRIGLEQGQAVPILGGGRLTGKVGNFSIGAVNIQTDNAPNAGAATTNFTVLRVKRDILRRSAIGAIFTGRSVSTVGPGSNEVYGLDGTFAFYDNVNLNGYYARTRTPGLEGDDESYQTAFTYNGDRYALGIDHLLVDDNFNPEIGFLRRDDFRRTFVQAQFSPRPASIDAVRQFTWGGSLEYILNGAGQLESRVAQTSFGTEFENSDRFSVDLQRSYELLVEPFDISSDVSIPVGGHGFQDYYASYSMGAQRKISGTFSLQRGEFFDGDITAIGYFAVGSRSHRSCRLNRASRSTASRFREAGSRPSWQRPALPTPSHRGCSSAVCCNTTPAGTCSARISGCGGSISREASSSSSTTISVIPGWSQLPDARQPRLHREVHPAVSVLSPRPGRPDRGRVRRHRPPDSSHSRPPQKNSSCHRPCDASRCRSARRYNRAPTLPSHRAPRCLASAADLGVIPRSTGERWQRAASCGAP